MKRKLFTLLLAFCLVATMMPAMTNSAFAADYITSAIAEIEAAAGEKISQTKLWNSSYDYQLGLDGIYYQSGSNWVRNTDPNAVYEAGSTYRIDITFTAQQTDIFKGGSLQGVDYPTACSVKIQLNGQDYTTLIGAKDGKIAYGQDGNLVMEYINGQKNRMLVRAFVTIPEIPVDMVVMDTQDVKIEVGEKYQLTASVAPYNATNKEVKWKSINTAVATVSSSGMVLGKKAGTTIITVTSAGKKPDRMGKIEPDDICTVTVVAKTTAVTGVTLDKSSLTLGTGGTAVLKATVSPADAADKTVTWLSSTPSVATVSASGVVTAIKAGTTQITAITADGNKSAACKVTVTAEPEQPTMPEQPTTPTTPTTPAGIIDPETGKTVDSTFQGLDMELDYTAAAYNGNDREPGVSIQDAAGNDLIEDVDYTLEYYNNRAVGKATVIVKGMGKYAGITAGTSFTIKPKAVTVKSVKKAASKKLTVKWASHKTQTTGFQIRYATTKSFKSGTYKTVTITGKSATSKTLTKLKAGKTYYVKVRAYKTVDGKKIYSSWSKAKAAKA